MRKAIMRLTALILGSLLALPVVGCQPSDKTQEKRHEQEKTNDKTQDKTKEKGLDVEIDTGGTKVKVKGGKKTGENERGVDVDVKHHPGRDSGDDNK